jgi:hypothetical protein
MKTIIWIVIIGFLLSKPCTLEAQENLLELTKKVNQSIERTSSSNIHIKYIQTSTSNNNLDIPQSVEVELKQKGKRQSMTSQHMDFFADSESAYVVYKAAKKIFIMKDVEAAKAKMQGQSIQKVLNMIWNSANISELSSPKDKTRRLKIIPSEEMQKVAKVAQLDLEFDAAKLQMIRTVLHMEEFSRIKKVEFRYLIINKDAGVKLFSEAKFQIFDSNEKLLKKYKGFSIEEV